MKCPTILRLLKKFYDFFIIHFVQRRWEMESRAVFCDFYLLLFFTLLYTQLLLSKFLTFFLSFLYLFNIVLEEQKNICLGFHCMKIHKLVLTSKHLFYWQSTLAIYDVLARGLFSRFLHINAMNMFWWCLHVSTIFYFHHFFKNISAVFLPWFVQATLKPLPLLIL